MGEELLLGSTRARPSALEQLDFRFDFPRLDAALRFELGRP
jgi:NAD dependent epimerase/dehydratase family enzyme